MQHAIMHLHFPFNINMSYKQVQPAGGQSSLAYTTKRGRLHIWATTKRLVQQERLIYFSFLNCSKMLFFFIESPHLAYC